MPWSKVLLFSSSQRWRHRLCGGAVDSRYAECVDRASDGGHPFATSCGAGLVADQRVSFRFHPLYTVGLCGRGVAEFSSPRENGAKINRGVEFSLCYFVT